MAKNEAKIKFTAETGEFNDAIKKANDEMGELRAELKLNETQMKSTGATVEGLEKQHGLLEKQLKASESKTEALSQKVQKAAEIFGENSSEVTKLKTQLANAQTAEEKVRQALAKCNQELEDQARAADEARSATAKLTDKIDAQQSELTQLKKKYADLVVAGKENTDEAKRLAREINDLSSELKQSKSAFSQATQAADKLDNSLEDVGDAAANTEDGFTIAKGAIADLASNAIQAAIGKVSEFVGWLAELPEATRELRQDFATLETSFESANLTTEQATNTWKELYKIFGEDDRAVEASNLIAKFAKNQEDLNAWVNITKGVWGSYQDSLPVEGLAEAANETAKTGSVTGVLADALNWSSEAADMFSKYMSEDVTTAEDAFNEALKECTTEEERQALITETLTALYGDAAKKYDEASGAQTEAKEAAAENILVQNELAETIEPLTTAWQGMKTEILTGIMPAVKKFSEWGVNALGWMKEHPVVMKTLAAVLGVVAAALGALIIVVTAYTIAQWAMNAAVLANPITWIIVGIVAAIAAVVAIIVLVIEYWDQIVAAVKKACSAVVSALQTAWNWVQSVFSSIGNWINTNVIQPCVQFFKNLWTSIVNIWNNIVNAVKVAIMFIGSVISAAWNIITLPFRFIWENCRDTVISIFTKIRNYISKALSAIGNFFSNLWTKIKNIFAPVASWFSEKFSRAKQAVQSAWSSVTNFFSNIWNRIKSAFSSVASWFSNIFSKAKSGVQNAWSGVKNFFSNIWSGIKSAFSAVGSWFSNTFNKAKEAMLKPIETARDKIKAVVDKIKGFFNNMKLKFPNIKMPHFKITGKFSLDPPSVPKLGIEWYSKAVASPMILNSPTIFGYSNGKLLGGGETRSEMIGGTNTVMQMIQGAVDKSVQAMNIGALAAAIEELADRPIVFDINGRHIALATAGDTDSVNGLRSTLKSRGLILD